VSDLAYDNIVR